MNLLRSELFKEDPNSFALLHLLLVMFGEFVSGSRRTHRTISRRTFCKAPELSMDVKLLSISVPAIDILPGDSVPSSLSEWFLVYVLEMH